MQKQSIKMQDNISTTNCTGEDPESVIFGQSDSVMVLASDGNSENVAHA